MATQSGLYTVAVVAAFMALLVAIYGGFSVGVSAKSSHTPCTMITEPSKEDLQHCRSMCYFEPKLPCPHYCTPDHNLHRFWHEKPLLAKIHLDSNQACTGVMVGNNAVLTFNDCVRNRNMDTIRVLHYVYQDNSTYGNQNPEWRLRGRTVESIQLYNHTIPGRFHQVKQRKEHAEKWALALLELTPNFNTDEEVFYAKLHFDQDEEMSRQNVPYQVISFETVSALTKNVDMVRLDNVTKLHSENDHYKAQLHSEDLLTKGSAVMQKNEENGEEHLKGLMFSFQNNHSKDSASNCLRLKDLDQKTLEKLKNAIKSIEDKAKFTKKQPSHNWSAVWIVVAFVSGSLITLVGVFVYLYPQQTRARFARIWESMGSGKPEVESRESRPRSNKRPVDEQDAKQHELQPLKPDEGQDEVHDQGKVRGRVGGGGRSRGRSRDRSGR